MPFPALPKELRVVFLIRKGDRGNGAEEKEVYLQVCLLQDLIVRGERTNAVRGKLCEVLKKLALAVRKGG